MKTFAVLAAALITAGSAWSVAQADEHQGRHRGHYHQQNWQNGQCNGQYAQQRHRDDDDENDNDDRDGQNQNGRYSNNGQYSQYGNGQYGQYGNNGQYGRSNANCGQYGQYGNGQYNGQYGQNGQYGRGGTQVVTGTIVAVNGNRVTLAQQNFGSTLTINDQPALDRQTSGRVSVGRYVTAYGYWQNGVFYATQMN